MLVCTLLYDLEVERMDAYECGGCTNKYCGR